jgi:hypothetical protein
MESTMSTPETIAVPIFQGDFSAFMAYLHEDESPSSISPRRYSRVLRQDMQAIATQAHVHRNTLSRAPESASVQGFLREALRVIRAAADISGSVEKGIFWFKNEPLSVFDYKTPQMLVSEGRTEDLLRYVQSLDAGFAG